MPISAGEDKVVDIMLHGHPAILLPQGFMEIVETDHNSAFAN